MILKGFSFVAFVVSVKAIFSCIHLICLVCLLSEFLAYGVVCFVVIEGVACQRSQ